MAKHHAIKPNIIYATLSQFFQLVFYYFLAFGLYKLMVYIINFDPLVFTYETLLEIDMSFITMISEFAVDNIHSWMIVTTTPVILLLLNIVNEKIDIDEDKIIFKKGFMVIDSEEFNFDEIIRYAIEKDFGFLNAGLVRIYTAYQNKIEIPYVINLKQASTFLDEIIQKNKQKMIEEHALLHVQDGMPSSASDFTQSFSNNISGANSNTSNNNTSNNGNNFNQNQR